MVACDPAQPAHLADFRFSCQRGPAALGELLEGGSCPYHLRSRATVVTIAERVADWMSVGTWTLEQVPRKRVAVPQGGCAWSKLTSSRRSCLALRH